MSVVKKIKLIECPRDAMQGWKTFIPTERKIEYLNRLLQVGFDTIDCGSFVSPKAMPQMADTSEVLSQLIILNKTKLLVIVANTKGAVQASNFDIIDYLGFPFSISETFQRRNTNSSINDSLKTVDEIQNICEKSNKQLVLYLSMGFGNPYGDPYNESILLKWATEMVNRGIKIISLADTVGVATPDQINSALKTLIPAYPKVEFGVHLHSTPDNWKEKLDAALEAGCLRFDGAMKGIGGCPMASNELVGNMNTELMIRYFRNKGLPITWKEYAFQKAMQYADELFVDTGINLIGQE